MNSFSERFKLLRVEKDLSQHQLSIELNIPRTTISSWELGRRSPDIKTIEYLADFFKVSIDYLLGKNDTRNPLHLTEIANSIYSTIKEDVELAQFIEKLSNCKELQIVSKQIKDLSKPTLMTLSKIIKALESDETTIK
ncbi:helix-turn-helix transcriptional regulator [Clostridium sp. A1-XYC3]|uniref:Helix-turn-helix transcriptional regulator n=1 Tax=Clostridium tanneri TaxID=3037988 RepID=A0ABU4JWV9_9CLOT|nr:helix-turn-helix transcriptional regulator [Clostridium sp. A1-XYC3]MDW8802639.1 helix-turn-helix transcriptional regulator [Clostridium sp. A1-XYC3]